MLENVKLNFLGQGRLRTDRKGLPQVGLYGNVSFPSGQLSFTLGATWRTAMANAMGISDVNNNL